jgi:uncharacterized protein YbaP (TraB family)
LEIDSIKGAVMKTCLTGIALLLWLVCNIAHADPVRSLIVPEKYTEGLLWKIESAQQEPSYLLGTMHVDDPGIWDMFKHAQKFFDSAKTVCTEVKLDFETVAAEMRVMFFSDGRTLKSVMNDDSFYQRTIHIANARGLPEVMVRSMKPFTLAFMLSMPQSKGQVLDEKIYTDAVRQDKQICGLETTVEHSNVFESFDMHTQVQMLKTTVERIDEVDGMYPVLLAAYLDRDLAAIARLVNESLLMEDAKIESIFIQRFLIDRNSKMAQRMIPLIDKGSAFFAVGAMHLTGKAGLLRLLEARGYTISRVY